MESKFTKLLKENKFTIYLFLIVLAFFFILFGITGVRTITGFFLFFFLPTYLIFRNFELPMIEKIAFSFFIGLGIFPTFVYYLGLLFASMRLAIGVSFILLMVMGISFNYYYPKYKKRKKSK